MLSGIKIKNLSDFIIDMSNSLNTKIVTATKWSSITEITAKLIAPISTMILARILTPDAFGILVTAQMIISFAEIFTDAGFQKYLVQHNFCSEEEKDQSTNVAFWSNFIMSMAIWVGIIFLSSPIADLVGCPGYGLVISVSSMCIPLAAFSSIQMALLKRDFDFKTLFFVRIIGICIPLLLTVPLAWMTCSYWSLIIGMIALNLSNAILLTVRSKWKPRLYYSFSRFKEMFSFTMWSMIEAVSIWLTSYVDIFIVGTLLSQHYLGIYRTSMSTVGQITGIITAATTPVLFSSLSRLQNDDDEFWKMFFKFQKLVSMLVFPLGVGIFLFSDLITSILLGSQWQEASFFIGFWGLTSAITIVLSHYSSEVYRAKGKPKLSVLSQFLHIIVLWPTVLIAVNYGFGVLCEARSLVRLEGILVNLIIMYFLRMPILKIFTNIIPPALASLCMCMILFFQKPDELYSSILYIVIAMFIYLSSLLLFPKERSVLLHLNEVIKKR